MSALKKQIGGDHYQGFEIQPALFIHKNNIPFMEGTALTYLVRWRKKGGIQDLEKAKHIIEMLIEMEVRDKLEVCERGQVIVIPDGWKFRTWEKDGGTRATWSIPGVGGREAWFKGTPGERLNEIHKMNDELKAKYEKAK